MSKIIFGLSLLLSLNSFALRECRFGKFSLNALKLTSREYLPNGSVTIDKLPTAYALGENIETAKVTFLVANNLSDIETLKIASINKNWKICVVNGSRQNKNLVESKYPVLDILESYITIK